MDAKTLPKDTEKMDLPGDAIGPRIWGVIDVLRKGRVAGWVIDRSDSSAVVEVDIHYEGRLIKTVKSDRHRPDLVKGGVGTGNYGFSAELDKPIDPDFAFTVTATARTADGVSAGLKRVGAAVDGSGPETRMVRRIFEEIIALRREVELQGSVATIRELTEAAGRLHPMIERIDLAQVRLNAAVADVEKPVNDPARSLRYLVGAALGVAFISLGIGIYSLWLG